ncbi:hypothetical protein B0H11DRAFT_194745 [Mycena galericulata]|nr:hypothetical protein B0H11DRAFT_194745 [Mycena galericulata]
MTQLPVPIGSEPAASTTATAPPIATTLPPLWLSNAMEAVRATLPNDVFDAIFMANSSAQWRMRCFDCPGKAYPPGPGETLSNFEIHLRNRMHRRRVNDRVVHSSCQEE